MVRRFSSWSAGRGRFEGCGSALAPKEKARRGKGKEASPAKSKGKGKAPSQAKSKRKAVQSRMRGLHRKKLLASTIQAEERANI